MNKNIICIVVCVLAILLMTVLDSRGQIGITGNAAFVGAAGFSAASGGGSCPSSPTVAQNVYNANQACGLTDGIGHYRTGLIGYTNAATINICGADFLMTYVAGDISGKTFKAYVYSLSGNNLDTLLATSSTTISGNNSWSHTTNHFEFSTPAIVSPGTRVAVFVQPTQAGDNSNYARIDVQDTDVLTPGNLATWNSTGGIELNATTNDPWVNIYFY